MKASSSFSFLFSLLSLLVSVTAIDPSKDGLYRGCIGTFNKATFECPKGLKKTKCTCSSPEYLASFMYCLDRSNQSTHNQIQAQGTMVGVCEAVKVKITTDDLVRIYKNATDGDYFIKMPNMTNMDNMDMTLYNPVKVKDSKIKWTVKSFQVGFFAKYTGELYGGIILAYWGFVLLVGGLINLSKLIAPKLVAKCNNGFWLFIRQKLATPATYGYSHSTPVKAWKIFNMAVPTRPQSIVLIGYGILHFILMFPKYELFNENTRFSSYGYQLSRYVSDRSGLIATAHLPLIFLFAGRNNIMLTLTGWSFETFNVYHRWVSRGMYLNAFIHSVSFSRYEAFKGDFPYIYSEERYVSWGMVATVCGGMIMFFSFRHFRERLHEFFLITHWVFVSLFLAGVWWHLQSIGYMQWVYASIAIWAFDRLCRFGRVIFSGLNAKAEVQLFPYNVMKFKIDYSNFWSPKAGNHVFVTFLRLTSFWQSHPFSIYRSPTPGEEKKMVLCIRKRAGVTKTLARSIASKPEQTISMPILIDGPYGQRFPMSNYSTVVFISGGIGATAAYSYLDGLKRAGRTEKQRLVFVWVVRNRGELDWFREELEYLVRGGDCEVRIFITNQGEIDPHAISSSDGEPGKEEKETEKESDSDLSRGHNDFNAIYCRPVLKDIISAYITEADSSIAFFTCGPPSMNDDARASVSKNLSLGKSRVEYFEESFAW